MDSVQRMSQPRTSLLRLSDDRLFHESEALLVSIDVYTSAHHLPRQIGKLQCTPQLPFLAELAAGCSQYMRSIIDMQPHGLFLRLGQSTSPCTHTGMDLDNQALQVTKVRLCRETTARRVSKCSGSSCYLHLQSKPMHHTCLFRKCGCQNHFA